MPEVGVCVHACPISKDHCTTTELHLKIHIYSNEEHVQNDATSVEMYRGRCTRGDVQGERYKGTAHQLVGSSRLSGVGAGPDQTCIVGRFQRHLGSHLCPSSPKLLIFFTQEITATNVRGSEPSVSVPKMSSPVAYTSKPKKVGW